MQTFGRPKSTAHYANARFRPKTDISPKAATDLEAREPGPEVQWVMPIAAQNSRQIIVSDKVIKQIVIDGFFACSGRAAHQL